ncbi:MAG TPA: ATP-binding protein [Thermoanaerobaculia bacterium]|nr:ATP-binding protein [Thermoanaerobaculia bacterium]
MTAAEQSSRAAAAVRRISRSVGAKLFTLLFSVLLLTLALLGYANVRLHRQHLEAARLHAAEQMNDVIRRSTSYSMLRNDRAAIQQLIETVGSESSITRLRVYNPQGRIAFSNHLAEVNGEVGTNGVPKAGPRILTAGGERVLSIAAPIDNSPTCSSAACHAHPASQKLLGVMETNVSLAAADADVRSATRQFVLYSAVAILLTLVITGLFVWRFVHRPVRILRRGTEQLGAGELGVQIPVTSRDELGSLAASFNGMSRQLSEAQQEITAWTRTLEERVQRKTEELSRAHQQMIQAEKLTSLGKLAAVVAHEINNPLSGILTYAKLLRKWVDRGESIADRGKDMHDALALIESESRRCGEIVRNLLTFARVAPMNVTDFDINYIIKQCVKLVEHKLELGNITPDLKLDPDLPLLRGDSGQIEQLLLALVMNAIEAMPHEGNLRIATTTNSARSQIIVSVADDGVGIDPDVLPRLFDPFVTTKEEGKGVGLGLAISQSIVERHQGHIEVASQVGRGTTFTITLPVNVGPTLNGPRPTESRPHVQEVPA